MPERTGILFVCLGNICRSPLAEGVFLHLARERGIAERFLVDSAGTGSWHVGEQPDVRARAVAQRNRVQLVHRARVVDPASDVKRFHWLIPMDRANLRDLLDLGAPRDRTRLLRSFDPSLAGKADHELEVPDPYYGGEHGFDEVFRMVWNACVGLHDMLGAQPMNERRPPVTP